MKRVCIYSRLVLKYRINRNVTIDVIIKACLIVATKDYPRILKDEIHSALEVFQAAEGTKEFLICP